MNPDFAAELADLIAKFRDLPGYTDDDIVLALAYAIGVIEEDDDDE